MSKYAERVALAWKKVLGEAPDAEDRNFFDAGGTSLKAAMLVRELEASGVYLRLGAIFQDGRFSTLVESAQPAEPQLD